MQHQTMLRPEDQFMLHAISNNAAAGIFSLVVPSDSGARIGRPGASISVSKIEGQCLSGFGAQGWKLDM